MTSADNARRTRRVGGTFAVLGLAALALTACTGTSTGGSPSSSSLTSPFATSSTASSRTSSPVASSTRPTTTAPPPPKPVHVMLNIGDGATIGVGLPIIATSKVKFTDARAFEAATKVTVNGTPIDGNWYFEYSDPASGHLLEAHYRPQTYWPANAKIHMDLPVKGKSAGTGLVFDNDLTLDFDTGNARVVTVSNATHRLTVKTNGAVWGTFPVSLGGSKSPTSRGTKVIMEKPGTITMSDIRPNGTRYTHPGVKYSQRLTYGGEYLHQAEWNVYNITHGINSSNGCTNLLPADAVKLFNYLQVGDPVEYPDANGPAMTLGAGYGDWNVTWSQWQTGGALPIK